MNNHYPENVISKILQITLSTQDFAYFSIDNKGVLQSQGGNMALFNLPTWSLQDNILNEALFLSGLLPMTHDYEVIPSLHISDTMVVDAHLFHDVPLNWIILVDKTKDIQWQSQARQKSNDLQLLQQQIASQKEADPFDFFQVLNIMALRLNKKGCFDLLKPVAESFSAIYPEAFDSTTSLNPQLKFPFIDNFLIDAQQLWHKGINHETLSSGLWVEKLEDGTTVALEARATNWNQQRLLLIEIKDASYQQTHSILQQGRENALLKTKSKPE